MPHIAYSENGVKFPSVTEILGDKPKPWLDKWREKWGPLADRKTKAAAAIGTRFHDLVEQLFLGEVVIIAGETRRIFGMLVAFEPWLVESRIRPLATEVHVINREHGYQGTLDAIGVVDNEIVLIDWKTSGKIYDDMALQLAAYAMAYREQSGIHITKGKIVCVSKDKPMHKLTTKDYLLDDYTCQTFLRRLEAYREFNDPLKKKEPANAEAK